ncbi:8-oxo-dGTP pyrophosphatase MutT, NUDIX family [Sanguibacter gelidistatuariae]|uniref:8-oxo-dGTP pyrophosphatase MutT, NUDIX family n=1 Tax=Sanguibacter gelidistatuariae TaxID=1814289 RepID=A0A1G6PRA8_9MICO|nr:NUDIX domain-containing protein [Sanguibacter gelidistatuariae]SDC82511.1 8-oxo-dGTP pyrophosphatase MutT, NUDIX family [Sanguibacter gelidistatuariae]
MDDAVEPQDHRTSDLLEVLAAWSPADAAQRMLRDDYAEFLAARPARGLERDGGPEHVTGSAFVFTPDLTQVLLCFHRKGQFWVQLGGHVEPGDASVAHGALREAHEESGLDDLVLLRPTPVDLDRHGLGDGFGRCAVHWDVGYAVVAGGDLKTSVSEESEALAWFPVASLPADTPDGFAGRVAGVLRELGAVAGA